MDTLFGRPVITDDALYTRLAAEGYALKDSVDAFCWLAERRQDSSDCPNRGCSIRCSVCQDVRFVRSANGDLSSQLVDHLTGEPIAPETERLRRDAATFAYEHRNAQSWLPYLWAIDLKDAVISEADGPTADQPTYMGYPVGDLVSPDY